VGAVQELKQENGDLRRELDAAQARQTELERELRDLSQK